MRRLRVTDYCPKLQKGRQKSGSALAGAATGTEAKVPFGALSTGLRATWGRVGDKLCGTKQADDSFKIAPTGAELTWDSRRSRRRARANHIQLDERKGFCPFIRCPILVMVTTTEPNSVREIILTPWQGRGGERPS